MSGFHLLTPSWTSGATISSNSQVNASVGADRLLQVQPSRKWRSTTVSTVRLTLDAGSSKPWNTLSLLFHNGYAGTIEVSSSDNSSTLFTAPSYTTGDQPLLFPGDLSAFPKNHTWIHSLSVNTHRYIGVEINDPTNPDGYIEAGVIVVGVDFEPPLGADLGSRFGRDDPSFPIRMLNGEAIVRAKRGNDVANWSFPYQDKPEAMHWLEVQRNYGNKIPVVVKWDPMGGGTSYQQHTFYYGYLQWPSGGALTYVNGHGRYTVQVGLIEV